MTGLRGRGCGVVIACCLLAACPPGGQEPELELARARNAVALERFDWARVHAERDLARSPGRPESSRILAVSWLSGYQRSLTSGIEACRRYLELEGEDAEIRQLLVSSLLLAGDWAAAREEAARLEESPTALRLAARAWLEADPERARDLIEGALALDPSDPSSLAVAAEVMERLGERGEALSHAAQATQLDPLDYQSRYLTARIRAASGDPAAAAEDLRLYRLASRVLHDGTMAPLAPADELDALSQIAAAGAAQSYRLRRRRAEVLFEAGQRGEGRRELAWLAAQPGVSVGDLLEFARWADNAGLHSVASDLLGRARELAPDDSGVLSSLAIVDLRTGDLEQAGERLAECLEQDATYARCVLLLARLRLAEGDEERALDRFARAVELAPWQADWRAEWAEALIATGRGAQVPAVLEAAPESSPLLDALAQRPDVLGAR